MTCLSVGLFGLSLVLMTVYDALFQDWDVVSEMRRWAHSWARRHRTRYVLMSDERMAAARMTMRMPPPERTAVALPGRTSPEVILPPLPSRDLSAA